MKRFINAVVSAAAVLAIAANTAFAAIPTADASDETVTFIVEVEGNALLASEEAAELGTDYLETEEAEKKETALLKTQARVLGDIKSEANVKASKGYTYTAVLNGFSIDAPKSKMDEIAAIDGVKSVSVASKMEPMLATSVELASSLPSQTADDNVTEGYTGDGQVIAIIDDSFDTGHEFFQTAPENPKYSKSDIADIIESNTMNVDVAVNQVYKSAKVPFAYNYGSNTADTYLASAYHGTHVAGIAAGSGGTVTAADENGEQSEYTLTGVAPEAQLVLMKVSDSEGDMYMDKIVAAIDDAVKIGVCAINLSLGTDYTSPASETSMNDVIANARKAGVMVLAASANSGLGYDGGTSDTDIPDYHTSGTPASCSESTSVAAATNTYNLLNLGTLTAADGTEMYYLNTFKTSTFSEDFTGETLEYEDCGYGYAEDFENVDVSGKIALISRDEGEATQKIYNAVAKANNAKAAGAIGVIFGNSMTGAENLSLSLTLSLPAVMVGKSDGEYLKNAENKTVTVSDTSLMRLESENGGSVSHFTAWGVNETLELKPEITAPGGFIYSSYPGDKYTELRGTSMAAPHMTGVAALMNEYLDKNGYEDLTGTERVNRIENMLMSAASVMYTPENDEGDAVPYSPRAQGAGLVNTAAAMKTAAIFIGPDGKSKISLGDGIDDTFTLSFTVKNLTNEDVVYDDVTLDVITNGYKTDADGGNYVTYDNMVRLSVVNSTLPESVEVPAGGEIELSVDVTLDSEELAENAEIFTNGFFIDGYVTLAVSGGEIPAISMPFTGFRGDWTAQPIFDKTMYDEGGSILSSLGGTFLYTEEDTDGAAYYLGIDANGEFNKDMIAISPNGDGVGDVLRLALTSFRAVTNLTMEFTGSGVDVTEMITGSLVLPKYILSSMWIDGLEELDEAELPDGEYTLIVSGEFNYEGAERESFELPVTVDRAAPKITGVSIDGDTLYVSVSDNNYLYSVDIGYTDETGDLATKTAVPDSKKGGTYTAEFDISGLDTDDITITVMDTAFNLTETELSNALGTVTANITDYSALGNMLSTEVELTNMGDSAVDGDAIIAIYDADGVLIAVSVQGISIDAGETAECEFEMFADTENAASAKLFIWDGVDDMRPLDITKSFQLAQ